MDSPPNASIGGDPCRPRVLFFCALVLLVLASAVTLWVWLVPKARRTITTSSGARLEFLGVAVGTNHYLTDPWWAHTARQVLPVSARRWVPDAPSDPPHAFRPQSPFQRHPIDATTLTLYYQWAFSADSVTIVDEGGFPFPAPTTRGRSDSGLRWVSLESYPRRQRAFEVRFSAPLPPDRATVWIRNPLPREFPVLPPQPLPATHTNGPVAVHLAGVTLQQTNNTVNVVPDWRLVALDPLWKGAEMPEFWVEDATGNRTAGAALSPTEKAWKLSTLVHRHRFEDFAPRETLTLGEVPLLGRTGFFPLAVNVNLNGVGLAVWGLSGGELRLTNGLIPGRTEPPNSPPRQPIIGDHEGFLRLRFIGTRVGTNTIETWAGESPFLLIEAHGLEPEDRLHCFVQSSPSARPKHTIPQSSDWGIPSDGGRRIFQLPIPAEQASPVTITLAVDRPRAFEFLVAPPPYPPVPHPQSGTRSP